MDPVDKQRLHDLQAKVTRLERLVSHLYRHLNVPHPAEGEQDLGEVRNLLREGRKIEAIRAYQLLTGAGLAAAKDAVEEIQRTMQP